MHTFTKIVAGAALALSVSVGFAQAASLTSDQVNAILNLLQSFGADQSIIQNVQLSLTGSAPSTSANPTYNGNYNNGGGDHHGMGMMGTTTPWMNGRQGQDGEHQGPKCIVFDRNLSQGAQGEDVKSLQQKLLDDGEFEGTPTGFFGPMTEHALAMWQEHNGIASSTNGGVLGPMTRDFFERRCASTTPPSAATTTQTH